MIFIPKQARKRFYARFPEERWAQRAYRFVEVVLVIALFVMPYWVDSLNQRDGVPLEDRLSELSTLYLGIFGASFFLSSIPRWFARILKRPSNDDWNDLFEEAYLAHFPISDNIVEVGPTTAELKRDRCATWIHSKPFFKRNLKAKAMFIAKSFQDENEDLRQGQYRP